MISLVFAWALIFTLPTHQSARAMSCPLGCRDSSESAAPARLGSVLIARHQQSRTWLAHGTAMKASADSFNVYWPTVRNEAAWQGYGVVPVTSAMAGTQMTVTVADTSHAYWYGVAPCDSSGSQACIAREVWRP